MGVRGRPITAYAAGTSESFATDPSLTSPAKTATNVPAPSIRRADFLRSSFISASSGWRRRRRWYLSNCRHLVEPDLLGASGRRVRESIAGRRLSGRPIPEPDRVGGVADDGLAGDYIFAGERPVSRPSP